MQSKYFFEQRAIEANRARHEKNKENGDRFIPARSADAIEGDINHAKLLASELNRSKPQEGFSALGNNHQNTISRALYGASHDYIHRASILGFSLRHPNALSVPHKKIPYTLKQGRILDAPNLVNNYYFDSLCWGSLLYVGLGHDLYACNPLNKKVVKIDAASTANSLVCSLAFNKELLARAGDDKTLQIIDLESYKEVTCYRNLTARYRQLKSDQQSGFFVIESSRLAHYDLRTAQPSMYFEHSGPNLVGLAFNENTRSLAVNHESTLCLYDIRNFNQPLWSVERNNAFTKAIAFSPDNNRLVTGGGLYNTTIQLWSTSSGLNLNSAVSGSQVCGLHWVDKELIVSHHGLANARFQSVMQNVVACWTVKNNFIEIEAMSEQHTGRVVFSAQNPKDSSEFAVCEAGETLSFWSVKPKSKGKSDESSSVLSMPVLR